MNELQIFNYNSAEVRTVTKDGEPWFVAKDVADTLGYTWHRGLMNHVPDEWKGVIPIDSLGGKQEMQCISEQGLYFFLGRSDKPTALPFQKWIAGDVMPSIRRHGAYMTPATIEGMIASPEFGIKLLTALREERERNGALAEENDKQRQIIGELKPSADYADHILRSMGTMTAGQIAADYNMSAKKLNAILKEERIIHNVNDQWILYSQHMGKGYTKSETIPIERADGRPDTKLFTKFTQKGRLMINEVLNRRGIYADMDTIRGYAGQ